MNATNFTIEPFEKNKTRWSRWVERFEGALLIFEIKQDEKKKGFLLHFMGQETYNVLSDRIAPKKPVDLEYKIIVETLGEYFNPKPLEVIENFKFHIRRQLDSESIMEFMTSLRRMAVHCNFGEYLDTALRNQFVFGVKNSQIQNRLLETNDLNIKKAMEIATAMELSHKGGVEINCKQEQTVGLLQNKNKVDQNKFNLNKVITEENEIKCFRCGSGKHLANKCYHVDTICSFCKKKGHIVSVCFQLKTRSNKQNFKSHANLIETNSSIEHVRDSVNNVKGDTEFEELLNIDHRGRGKYWLEVEINNTPHTLEIDTGAPVSLINVAYKNKYFEKVEIYESGTKLSSYCNQSIPVLGFINVNVTYNHQTEILRLFVVDSDKHPLAGREWLKAFDFDFNKLLKSTQDLVLLTTEKNALSHTLDRYAMVFQPSMGKITGLQAELTLQPDCKPVYIKPRQVPFAIKNLIENELDLLEEQGILKKVNTSRWATPIVPVRKANNKIRLCGDYKITLNPNLCIDEHPLPTVNELFSAMAGGQKFSKIDLKQAYLQLEVREEDRELLTLNTHKGLYRPTRLMYGVASAPAIWQRQIEQILQGIEGVTVFLDDIKVTGPNDQIHLSRLQEILERLSTHNMRVNKDKCNFFADTIEYCGYIIDRNGIHKASSKIKAIQDMPRPKNKDQVRSFIGLVNYYGKFFKNLSSIIYPLNNVLKMDVQFNWNTECETAFKAVKLEMQTDTFLVHYDETLPLLLATDASPIGVGAVLSHRYPDGSERPIQYASQTLNKTQQNYTQIDKEAYAIIFGIKKFYQYVYGRSFILITDNKPITQIFSPKKGLPAMAATRMQHYAVFLQSFQYEIIYRNTKEHGNADAFSRLPVEDTTNKLEESDVIEVNMIETLPITVQELAEKTLADKSVHILIEGIRQGRTVDLKHRFNIEQSEFTLQQNCLLRGVRVYVPLSLRKKVLEELHSTHFGISRMKSLARGYCWWVGIDRDLETMSQNCTECQSNRNNPNKAPLHCWEVSTEPFQRVHIDFAGPLLGVNLLILVDSYSKWTDVKILKNITTEATIKHCREFFSNFGIPSVIVTDHGSQFTAEEFGNFLKMNGIVHKMGAPYHPSTNGQVERYVETIKDKIKALNCNANTLHKELANILLTYRKTIHPATGKSPSMLVFGRQIRSRLDLMIPTKDRKGQTPYIDRNNNNKTRSLEIGTRVSVREYLVRNVKWRFGVVSERLGQLHYNVKLDDGRMWLRHIDQIRVVGKDLPNSIAGENVSPSSRASEECQTDSYSYTLPNLQNIPTMRTNREGSDGNENLNDFEPVPGTLASPSQDRNNVNNNNNELSNDASTVLTQRRSTRIKRAPQRLDL